MKYRPDWIAQPHAIGMVGRLAQELEARGLPELCALTVVGGAQAAFDSGSDCEGGMGWVRVAGVFPSTNFPSPNERPTNVVIPAVRLEVGIVRPIVVEDNGEASDPDTKLAEAELALADMGAMLTAICAYGEDRDVPLLIESYVPTGPQGGLMGGAWTAVLQAL